MKLTQKFAGIFAATATALAVSAPVQAADEVNVAFFLEWATPRSHGCKSQLDQL